VFTDTRATAADESLRIRTIRDVAKCRSFTSKLPVVTFIFDRPCPCGCALVVEDVFVRGVMMIAEIDGLETAAARLDGTGQVFVRCEGRGAFDLADHHFDFDDVVREIDEGMHMHSRDSDREHLIDSILEVLKNGEPNCWAKLFGKDHFPCRRAFPIAKELGVFSSWRGDFENRPSECGVRGCGNRADRLGARMSEC
jgi:hypothetical protein